MFLVIAGVLTFVAPDDFARTEHAHQPLLPKDSNVAVCTECGMLMPLPLYRGGPELEPETEREYALERQS